MNADLLLFSKKIMILIVPLSVFIVTFLIGYILRSIFFRNLSRWAGKTKTDIDDIIIDSSKGPFLIWCLMLGIYLGLEFSNLPHGWVSIAGKMLLVLGLISIMLVLANISTRVIKSYSSVIESTLPVTSLTQNISRIIIFGVGILIILNNMGISITPILATLGVGGLAVALALQDTLSNLFAGFHIIVARQVKIGDYIKLESGEEGYVTDINWRTTQIRMLPNNVVLVPNAKLTRAIITNYYLPDKEMAVLINVGVHYDSDLSIGFTVIMRAKEFVDQYLIKHEFVKRLHERYAKEGIIVPYPIRAINYEQERRKQ